MNWVYLAAGSVIFFTTLNLLQKVIAGESSNPRATAILFNVVAAIYAILLFMVSGAYKSFSIQNDRNAYIVLLIAAFCYGMFERGRFVAAKYLEASVFTTISNLSVLVAFIGSLFLYSESLTLEKIIGGTSIIIALLIISIENKDRTVSKKGLLIAVFISIMLGLGWMLDKLGTTYFDPNVYNVFLWTIPIIFIWFPSIKASDLLKEFKNSSWKIVILSGLNVAGSLMQLKALQLTEATKVIPIVQTSSIFTVILGIFILKEKSNIIKKIVAGLLAIAGVYLLI
jgi:uncharacterized membrane protein